MTPSTPRPARLRHVGVVVSFVALAFVTLCLIAVPNHGTADADTWDDPALSHPARVADRTQNRPTHRNEVEHMISRNRLRKDSVVALPLSQSSLVAVSNAESLASCPSTAHRERLPRAKVDEIIAYWSEKGKSAKGDRSAVESIRRMLLDDVCGVVFEGNPGKVTAADLSRAASWHWLRSSGAVGRTFDCPAVARRMATPLPIAITHSPDWRREIHTLPWLPLESAPDSSAFPDPPVSTFVRAPKTASWVVGSHVCATCESSGAFYMNPRHSCFFTLWGFGDETSPSLKKLVSASRRGRNAIFKEREGSFQFGGVLPSPPSWNMNHNTASHTLPSREVPRQPPRDRHHRRIELLRNARFVSGTVIWNGAYEVDNVGHVIHDALWAWQLTVMLRNLLQRSSPDQKHRYGDGIAVNDGARASRSSFPKPIRAVFAHDFSNISSEYFGMMSWIIAKHSEAIGEVTGVFRSPFESGKKQAAHPKDEAVCFERLILPGQDRHADGGGLGLRRVVAQRLRRVAFQAAGVLLPVQSDVGAGEPPVGGGDAATRPPTIYVYGRNDVYRRSIDNTHQLWLLASRVARALGLPAPVLIDTFQRPPLEQVKLMSLVDVLLAIQGSHMQNSLFMPDDGVIIELAPCRANRVSFIQRYGKYLDTQEYTYIPLCDGVVINYSDSDAASQNVTLCSQMLLTVEDVLRKHVAQLVQRRGIKAKS